MATLQWGCYDACFTNKEMEKEQLAPDYRANKWKS